MSPPPVQVHGRRVLPMPVHGPGSSDRIVETIRHFLEPKEAWEKRPPLDALAPLDACKPIDEAEGTLEGFSKDDECWWAHPLREAIDAAHDEGYWPRYVQLVDEAGPIDVPGSSTWVRIGMGLISEVGGCVVVVQPSRQGSLKVIRAYRVLANDGYRASLGKLGDRVKGWCQQLMAAASGEPGKPEEGKG